MFWCFAGPLIPVRPHFFIQAAVPPPLRPSLPRSSASFGLFLTVLPGLTLPHSPCNLGLMVILLPQSSKCQDDRHELPYLLTLLLGWSCFTVPLFFSILLALSILLCNSVLEVHFSLHPGQESPILKLIPLICVWSVHFKVWLGSREGHIYGI